MMWSVTMFIASRYRFLVIAALATIGKAGPLLAAEFFDDFHYVSGGPSNPIDPQFECFGWYVRTEPGGPGPAGAAWRADFVTWAEDASVPGNRVMRLRAVTDGTAAGTVQSEVDTNEDLFYEGTYCARIRFADPPAGPAQRSVQAFTTYKGLLCDPNYSECDIEYTPRDPWSNRCGTTPALHLQTWEQYCDNPYLLDLYPAQPAPVCGSLAGWHIYTIQISGGTVRYYVDGLLRASHGGNYYPESAMRILLLHWFAGPLSPGVATDLTMEVDWLYYARNSVLSASVVESIVSQYRADGVRRRNTLTSFADCNANAIPDYCEPDSDGDGTIDACDTCPHFASPDQQDSDGDGSGDLCDNCPGVYNPGQEDADEDGVGDACDSSHVWRVKWDASGLQTGLSWADAYRDLQTALAAAAAGDEIWVAAGTYRPAGPGGDRNAVFPVRPGVSLYGGFAGAEARRSQRDPSLNRTILSGDLNGDDGPAFANTSENSRVVLDGSATDAATTLDGFTVTAANGAYGGGLYLDGGFLTVRHCTFEQNQALFGGGICMHESGPTIDRCFFHRNAATLDGGALYVDMGSSPLINVCVFDGNTAAYAGGATRILMSSPVFVSCRFRQNTAPHGAAVQNYEAAGPIFANCLFHGNVAGARGGAMQNNNSTPFVVNCTITMNSAAEGGGIHGWPPSVATVANSILWGNADGAGQGESAQVTVETASVSYSCVQNWTGLGEGPGVTSANPLFADPDGSDNIAGTDDDNLRLRYGSPCIDAGDNTVVPPDISDLDADGNTAEPLALDVEGYRRFEDVALAPDRGAGTAPLIDMGAHEYGAQCNVPADHDMDGDVDLADFNRLQACFNGPNRAPAGEDCGPADVDYDGDVDLADFTAFLVCFNGPNRPPACE